MPAYVPLPGSSGNYFETSDLNAFESDMAHMFQSLGDWTGGTAQVDLSDAYSGKAYRTTTTGSTKNGPSSGGGFQLSGELSGGETITVSIDMLQETDPGASRFGYVAIREWDNNPTSLGFIWGTVTELTYGEPTRLSVSGTLQAGTRQVQVFTYYQADSSANPGADEDFSIYNVMCDLGGTSTTFVPSLRIVGDLEAEWKVALDDYTPASTNVVLSTFDNSGAVDGYEFGFNTSGGIFLRHGSGSDARTEASSATGLTDGATHVFKATVDVSTGAVVYYIDGVQHDTDTMATGAASPSGKDLYVGATTTPASYLDGDLYYVILRDGIDGPIVAKFDADDWVGI